MQREFVFDLVSYIGSTRPALRLGLGMPSEHFYKTRKYNLGLETAWSRLELVLCDQNNVSCSPVFDMTVLISNMGNIS